MPWLHHWLKRRFPVHTRTGTLDALLSRIYGPAMSLHHDLYEMSEQHRNVHGPECSVFPSSPRSATMWPLLGAIVRARRLLEVGCGLGYTAALMAEAGGPSSCVDTIEQVHDHAGLAEKELRKRGLAERVRVLRGEASALLAMLSEPYDLVFVDGDWKDYPALLPDLKRLTHRGGVLLTSNLFPLFEESASGLPDRD